MPKHDFKEYGFETSALAWVDGELKLTCCHIIKCILCDLVLGNTENPHERITCNDFKPELDDCTQRKPFKAKLEKPKEVWKSPMKSKVIASESDIKAKDYPKKRDGYEAKRRRK